MAGRRIEQAGAIVYRRHGAVQFLLVRSKRTPEHWIFPKGHIEAGESADAAALREAREEAGVEGRIVDRLYPAVRFEWGADQVQVKYFLVECTALVDDHEPREQVWLPPKEALKRVTHDDARQLLETALEKLRP